MKNILIHAQGAFKRLVSYARQDPARDWLVIMTVAVLALGSIIVWNIWAFDTVAGGGVIGTATVEKREDVRSESIQTIHTIFASRAAERAKYISGEYRYTDPSQ